MKLTLFLMTEKGHAVLREVLSCAPPGSISMVIGGHDGNVQKDYYDEIKSTCQAAGVKFLDKSEAPQTIEDHALAISWRWMIKGAPNLITLHDSLLPRYRGFAPLPNALVNGEPEVGVTALFANDDYDRGDIICQRRLPIHYPMKIQKAIEGLLPLYASIVAEISSVLSNGSPLPRKKQDETKASYSLWRDELDYNIDWSQDAPRIKRHIDAVGYPYSGARTLVDGQVVSLLDAEVESDIRIENRTPGKVVFVHGGCPVVVCGSGLLRITEMVHANGTSALPLKKFRSRFGCSEPAANRI